LRRESDVLKHHNKAKTQEDIRERGEKERRRTRQGIKDAFSAPSLFRMLSELGYGI
jgi:hypothetical protein